MLCGNLLSDGDEVTDSELEQVKVFFSGKKDLAGVIGRAVRKSFDEVIDGPRTGRYCIDQLEKTEKTYIGTKIEIILRDELGLERGLVLDNLICGIEVDTKFTIGSGWMIPKEAFGKICLLVSGDDNLERCKAGLLRMTPDVLTKPNQDKKSGVSAVGKARAIWLVDGAMPQNFLLKLEHEVRSKILGHSSGLQRVRELFKSVTHTIIPRSVIEQLARQKDPMKRAREMKESLRGEGFLVLCSTYTADQVEFIRYGFNDFDRGDWLSIKVDGFV